MEPAAFPSRASRSIQQIGSEDEEGYIYVNPYMLMPKPIGGEA